MGRKPKAEKENYEKKLKGLKVESIYWLIMFFVMFMGVLALPFVSLSSAKNGDAIGTYWTYTLFGLALFGLIFCITKLLGLNFEWGKIEGGKNGA